jgi:chemotaxis signal transduction protein
MVSPAVATATLRLVRCRTGGERYGLEMTWVHGIQRADRLRPDPGAGGRVGWLPGRGGEVEVFSLAALLGRPFREAGAGQHALVLNTAPARRGILVDHVAQAARVEADHLLPLPALARPAAGFFEGLVLGPDEVLLVLAPERLCPDAPSHGCPDGEGAGRALGAAPVWDFAAGKWERSPGQLVLFPLSETAAGERPLAFGLSIAQVAEIVESPALTPVPGAPAVVRGLVAWRGRAVPVLDLAQRLGLPPLSPGRGTRLLVARDPAHAGPVGLLVRAPVRMLRLPAPHTPSDRPLPVEGRLVKARVELKAETLVVPDLGRACRLG